MNTGNVSFWRIRFLLSVLGLSVLFAGKSPARENRLGKIVTNLISVYSQPADSSVPILMARKDQVFPIYFSHADDSGAIWFSLKLSTGRNDTGWVKAKHVRYISVPSDSLPSMKKQAEKAKQERKRRYAVLRKNPHWSRKIRSAVREGEIVLHMTRQQLEASWGPPAHRSKAFMIGVGNYEVCFYTDTSTNKTLMVTLQNGIVTGWTED